MAAVETPHSANPNATVPEVVQNIPGNARPVNAIREFPQEKLELMKRTICKGATDDQFELFILVCRRTGLDPFQRQIYAVFRKGKRDAEPTMTIQTGIDGFRLIAERSNRYEGQVGPFWCGEDGIWHDVWLHKTPPKAAKVGVKKTGFSEVLWAVARWDSYVQMNWDYDAKKFVVGTMWEKLPDVMIAKVAEALALRKAFPNDLAGLYTSDEMSQADGLQETKPRRQGQLPNQGQNQQGQQGRNQNTLPPPQNKSIADYVSPIGKFQGMALKDISRTDLTKYVQDVREATAQPGAKPLAGKGLDFVNTALKYLKATEPTPEEIARQKLQNATDEMQKFMDEMSDEQIDPTKPAQNQTQTAQEATA